MESGNLLLKSCKPGRIGACCVDVAVLTAMPLVATVDKVVKFQDAFAFRFSARRF